MPIRIALAHDEYLIEQAFRVRHQVFCQEEDLIRTDETQFVMDRFDAFPATKIFVALDESGHVVGSMRVTMDSPVGLPADEYYDFRAHTPQTSRLMSVSMFCIAQSHRNAIVSSGLIMMCTYFALAHNVDHVFMPLNPTLKSMVRRIGAKPLTRALQRVPHLNVAFTPFMLNMTEMSEMFMNFAKQNIAHNMIQSYDCMIFKKGEQIIRKGDIGDCAYVIVDGAAKIVHPDALEPIVELSEGDVIGAQELFSEDNVRPADVFASSVVRAMVLPKTPLLEYFKASPDAADNVLHSINTPGKSLLGC